MWLKIKQSFFDSFLDMVANSTIIIILKTQNGVTKMSKLSFFLIMLIGSTLFYGLSSLAVAVGL